MICDLAETYGVFDYRALPLPTVATLVSGLRENSRIHAKKHGLKAGFDTVMIVRAEDGKNGTNPPRLYLSEYIEERKQTNAGRFASADEFERYRSQFFR